MGVNSCIIAPFGSFPLTRRASWRRLLLASALDTAFCWVDMVQAERITFNPLQCGGKPCIRGMRIRVSDLLDMLAEGVTQAEILADFPDLEAEDIKACLHFAARRSNLDRLVA